MELGSRISIDGINMMVVERRSTFSGTQYLLAYFHGGDIKTVLFSEKELEAWKDKQ